MTEQTREEISSKEQYWEAHIEGWKQSGISQTSYCRQKGLKSSRFTYWKSKLNRKSSPVTFVQVKESPFQPLKKLSNANPIKLIVDNRYQLEIGDQFNPYTLEMVIRILGRI